jgi:hypothetical protein
MSIKRNKKVTEYIRVINEAKQYFEALEEKQQESYDSKSDNWKDSEKGEEFQEDLDYLGDLNSSLNEAVDVLDSLYEEI